jgi:hypothetical protein
MRKFLMTAVLAMAMVVGTAGVASAGEVTGNGKPTGAPANSNSICSFSGLEDGSEPGTTAGPGNVQNWGHIPKDVRAFLRTIGEYPGRACNGHLSGLKH